MTTATSPVKVRCFPVRTVVYWTPSDRSNRFVEATSALPFAYSRNSTYCHRVRSVRVYGDGSLHVRAWCGQHLSIGVRKTNGRMGTDVPEDRTLCGTCHGRAIGAGQIDTEGTPLIFSPQAGEPNLGRCVWEHPGSGPYGHPWRCHRPAVFRIPEAPDGHKAGTCGEHTRKWPPSVGWRYEASLNNGDLTLDPAKATPAHGGVR